jgi:hypothetical protein
MRGRRQQELGLAGPKRLWGTGPFWCIQAGVGEPAESIACLIRAGAQIGIELSWEQAISLLPRCERYLKAWAATHPEEVLALLEQYVRLYEP